jgi:glutamate synthase (NADPH/NADH) small chain
MPKPPDERSPETPWPMWPMQLRVESSHEEGGIRDWSVNTVRFSGDADGNVKKLHAIRVGAPPKFEAQRGTEFEMYVDLVLLAMGFTGPVRANLRGGRCAPWSVAGCLGHRGRPQSRAWRR